MNKKGRGEWIMLIMLIPVIFMMLFSFGFFDRFCDYQFKEEFQIKEFEVSVGGFASPTLINIKTTENKNKVVNLYSIYESMEEISEGDIIVCEEDIKNDRLCVSKIECFKKE